jgi:cell wall-associated NlpC family hydrolase
LIAWLYKIGKKKREEEMRTRRHRRQKDNALMELNRPGKLGRLRLKIMRARAAFAHYSGRRRVIVFGAVGLTVVVVVLLAVLLPGGVETVAQPGNGAALVEADGIWPVAAAGSASPEASVMDESSSVPSPTPSSSPEPTPTPTPDPTLKKGDENERVQELQERLMDLGYLDIDETTQLFGPATKYAVQLFQRQHELKQDGIAGPQTLAMIYSDDAKKYTLLQGTRGEDVDSLQRQLVDLGYMSKTTGYYGDETVAAVKAFQESNDLTADGKTGEHTLDVIYSPDAKPSATKVQAEKRRANINKMLEVAEDQLGKPYVLGREGPNSFDCSGLVYYCLKQAGSSRGRYNAAGYSKVSDWEKIESMDDMEKGDLIFFWHSSAKTRVGHVGIYIGDGMMIDASTSNGKVVKRSCTTATWKRLFVCARRPW